MILCTWYKTAICILHLVSVFTYLLNPTSCYFPYSTAFMVPLSIDPLTGLSRCCFERGKASVIFLLSPFLRMKKTEFEKVPVTCPESQRPRNVGFRSADPEGRAHSSQDSVPPAFCLRESSVMRKSKTLIYHLLSLPPFPSLQGKRVSGLAGLTPAGTALQESPAARIPCF